MRRVFLSSVMQGYEDRRQAAAEAIRGIGMEPILAEDLAADGGTPQDIVMEELRDCDAVVGIYGNRYGWTGARSGDSPTEEEYHEARRLWKPVYAFIDRMEGGRPEGRQRQFLEELQNWDVGVMRREFGSLDELERKIRRALTEEDLSPRYRSYLRRIKSAAAEDGYREIVETRLPAFDLLLHKKYVAFVHFDMVLAVMGGDPYDPQQLAQIASRWKTSLVEHFKPSNWRQTGIEAALVVAVEDNPHALAADHLPRDRSRLGGYYGLIVDLAGREVVHPRLRLKDRAVKTFWIEPILAPALASLRR